MPSAVKYARQTDLRSAKEKWLRGRFPAGKISPRKKKRCRAQVKNAARQTTPVDKKKKRSQHSNTHRHSLTLSSTRAPPSPPFAGACSTYSCEYNKSIAFASLHKFFLTNLSGSFCFAATVGGFESYSCSNCRRHTLTRRSVPTRRSPNVLRCSGSACCELVL